ncbi:MAG: metal-sensing transcriptional repressor [Bacteroides sp.]|nr:metal-sensing transcriptional repressor [Bacillota bacterium]MCM1393287.1 metal-sensing transcriptional repressor [[Eubacterium] siraeum]MCM1455410.1 metal-sensing transcriptional repressor [Bacteroides sp.]
MENKCCCSTRTKKRTAEEKRALEIRLNKIIGQLNGIKNMVAEDRYCDDILIQLSAADKSIKSLANLLLDAHMHTCLVENVQAGNIDVVDEIVDLFKRFQ